MDSSVIVQQMNDFLFKANEALVSWLNERLPQSGEDWWEECVLSNLTFRQRELAERKGFTELKEFDLAALLRIADKSWYTMRCYLNLTAQEG